MRDIKFRGKRVDNGEWVYGAFVPDALEQTHSDMVSWGFIRRYNGSKSEMIEVDRKTVGEYTGLKDKNGREIYEGDILTDGDLFKVFYNSAHCTYMAKYIKAKNAEKKRGYFRLGEQCSLFIEVIGNIYENPELLED